MKKVTKAASKAAVKKEVEVIEPVYPTEKELLDKEYAELNSLLEDLKTRGLDGKQDIEVKLGKVIQRLGEISQ